MENSTRPQAEPFDAHLGIDLGGTYTRVAWMGPAEEVLTVAQTPDGKLAAAFLQGLVVNLRQRGLAWTAIGVSAAPGVDARGVITDWPSRPDWIGVPLVAALRTGQDETIVTKDDGICGALWEHEVGGGGGVSASLGLGTGLAVGVVNNRVAVDTGQGGGSIAHLPAPGADWICRCGRTGCFQVALTAESLIRAFENKSRHRAHSAAERLLALLAERFQVRRVTLTGGCCRLLPADFLLSVFQHPDVEIAISATPSSSGMGGALLAVAAGSAASRRIPRCLQAIEVELHRRYDP
jgi:predicted NBD/HSP70 family sugar kinase